MSNEELSRAADQYMDLAIKNQLYKSDVSPILLLRAAFLDGARWAELKIKEDDN